MFLYSTGVNKPWPYFGIESKRLHVSFPSGWQSLISEYVTGHQGMMCFRSDVPLFHRCEQALALFWHRIEATACQLSVRLAVTYFGICDWPSGHDVFQIGCSSIPQV